MQFLLIDAFADGPFTGNPAAVVLLDRDAPDAWRQNVGMEFNQAETAFVRERGPNRFELRWFTPVTEVPLCGHATLASAHALREWGKVDPAKPIVFETRFSGELRCAVDGERIVMDFPAGRLVPGEAPVDAAPALGVTGAIEVVNSSAAGLLLKVADEAQVLAARPDFRTIAAWNPHAVCITARAASAGVDFVSRFFAPNAGIDEDHVTGSAHCVLVPYWAGVLGKTEMTAVQLSKRRGTLGLGLRGDRVELAGRAVTTAAGALRC